MGKNCVPCAGVGKKSSQSLSLRNDVLDSYSGNVMAG